MIFCTSAWKPSQDGPRPREFDPAELIIGLPRKALIACTAAPGKAFDPRGLAQGCQSHRQRPWLQTGSRVQQALHFCRQYGQRRAKLVLGLMLRPFSMRVIVERVLPGPRTKRSAMPLQRNVASPAKRAGPFRRQAAENRRVRVAVKVVVSDLDPIAGESGQQRSSRTRTSLVALPRPASRQRRRAKKTGN